MSSLSAASGAVSSSTQSPSPSQQVKVAKDLRDLAAALKASNTKAAEKALLQLQNDSASSDSASGNAANNPLSKVQSSLRSDDILAAQQEFADFEAQAAAYASSLFSDDGPASSTT